MRYGNAWRDMGRLQREMDRLLGVSDRSGVAAESFPAVNIWTGEDDALLTAEIPGVDPGSLDVTVAHDTVTIRGNRETDALRDGETWLKRERGDGSFVRSFALPFQVDGDKVVAHCQKGILQVKLPRREADKPRTVTVHAG